MDGIVKLAAMMQREDDNPAAPAQPLPLIEISAWHEASVPQREWAVLDRIPLRQTTLHSGLGAAGKSIIELQRCVAHVRGRDWLGTMPEPGAALFIDCEDDENELHIRLAAILDYYGASFADVVRDGLNLISFAGRDAVLAAVSRSGKIVPTALYTQLFEFVGDTKPKTIAIASSANVFAGNENDRAQVQQFISLTTRLAIVSNGSVVLITHPSLTGINSDSGLSGNTAWHNSCRARYYLKSIEPADGEQPDSDLREIVFKKNNYGPVGARIVLRYQNGLFLPVPGMSSLDQAAAGQKTEEKFIDALSRLTEQGQDLGPNPTASNYAPTVIVKQKGVNGIRKGDLAAAMQRLLDGNKIHIRTSGPPSKQRKVLVPGPKPEVE